MEGSIRGQRCLLSYSAASDVKRRCLGHCSGGCTSIAAVWVSPYSCTAWPSQDRTLCVVCFFFPRGEGRGRAGAGRYVARRPPRLGRAGAPQQGASGAPRPEAAAVRRPGPSLSTEGIPSWIELNEWYETEAKVMNRISGSGMEPLPKH
jgi:hypothetical protein